MPGSENSMRTSGAVTSKADPVSTSWYAEVAPSIPLPATGPQVYTYRVPAGLPPNELLFTLVNISLGARQVRGVVTRLHRTRVPYPTKELRPAGPWQLTAHQVALAQWLHETMRGGLGYTLRLFFPPGKRASGAGTSALPLPVLSDQVVSPRVGQAYQAGDTAIIEQDERARAHAIAERLRVAVARHQQAVVIVPETWMVHRLHQLLAKELPRVAMAENTAALATTAATKLWQRVLQGDVSVVIGTQKSFFLPWRHLGAIVVEEEFYSTHKHWDQYPRLDNRLAAGVLAVLHHSAVTYATSMPSLTLFDAVARQRVAAAHQHPLVPTVTLVPLTFADNQARRLLPEQLIVRLKTWLKARERVVVLHNTIGTWRTLFCRSCHTTIRCPTCGVTAVVHGSGKKMVLACHHCDLMFPLPAKCPTCKRTGLTMFGAGNEKMSEVLQALFPGAALQHVGAADKPARLVSRKKGGQIIIGTSALFTRLSPRSCDRAVYLFPERALQYPDFRSEERAMITVARLAQLVAGPRAITVVTAKKALVQEQNLIASPAAYQRLLQERQRLGYPPYQDMVLATLRGTTSARARTKAVRVRQRIEDKKMPISVRGPFASYQKLRRGQFEQHLLLLGRLADMRAAYADQPIETIDVFPERIL